MASMVMHNSTVRLGDSGSKDPLPDTTWLAGEGAVKEQFCATWLPRSVSRM